MAETCTDLFAVISRISAIETFEYSLVLLLSIYHFEKVCFPAENVKIGDQKNVRPTQRQKLQFEIDRVDKKHSLV